MLYDSFGYEPGSIKGKYQFLEIGSGFYYDYWMPTMKSNWGSEAAVRESFAPSAMVDWQGDLYTAHVSGFDSSGIKICLKKNVNGSTSLSKEFYPWTYIPNTTVAGKVSTSPNCTLWQDDGSYFKKYIHNAFMPALVQDTDQHTTYVRMFIYIPSTRLMNANCTDSKKDSYSSIEGVMSMRWKKSGLQQASNPFSRFYYHADNKAISFNVLGLRCDSNHKYPVFNSNFAACLWYGPSTSVMWLYYLTGLNSDIKDWKYLSYIQTATTLGEKNHGDFSCGAIYNLSENCRIGNRFIKYNDYIYFIAWNAGYWVNLFMQDLDNQYFKATLAPSIFAETIAAGTEKSPYDYDFCLLKNENTGKMVLGLLCLGGNSVDENNNSKPWTSLSNSYNWTGNYCKWTTKNLSLVLRSFPLTEGTATQDFGWPGDYPWATKNYDWPQNTIYTTDIERASNSACNLANITKEDVYRLYLNTHRICTDVTNPDSKYIFYCYCYPGKQKQLFFGYARYHFDTNNRIMLGPQYEFRSSSKQWEGDSFGEFKYCSRIISMDCKNGHLWITWMNDDNTKYYAFHILVKDLVGE